MFNRSNSDRFLFGLKSLTTFVYFSRILICVVKVSYKLFLIKKGYIRICHFECAWVVCRSTKERAVQISYPVNLVFFRDMFAYSSQCSLVESGRLLYQLGKAMILVHRLRISFPPPIIAYNRDSVFFFLSALSD